MPILKGYTVDELTEIAVNMRYEARKHRMLGNEARAKSFDDAAEAYAYAVMRRRELGYVTGSSRKGLKRPKGAALLREVVAAIGNDEVSVPEIRRRMHAKGFEISRAGMYWVLDQLKDKYEQPARGLYKLKEPTT